ncbi:MAG TPA: hypothetical protein VD996_11555 [Chitinophagaceae bacterium]|nr:hypothetical protein [Chitinophagaceae bacterium]
MKKVIALTSICIGLFTLSFAEPAPKKSIKVPFDCSVSMECGGVTVTATGSTCAEAGQKAGAACDKILTVSTPDTPSGQN